MYARSIPKQLPVNLAIPQIFDTIFNTVWYNLGHPLNTQNQPLTGYTQVASYNQDGTWTGNWAILSLGNVASGLAIGNKSASFNWLGHVCTKT